MTIRSILILALCCGAAALGDMLLPGLLEGAALAVPYAIVGRVHDFAQHPAPTNPRLQALAISYRAPRTIFRDVMPAVRVDYEEYKYWRYDRDQPFTVPETRAGRRGELNQVEFSGEEILGNTRDYGLLVSVPAHDRRRAASQGTAARPDAVATEGAMDLIELQREQECADVVFAAATYPDDQHATLAAAARWTHADSNPITAILQARDDMLFGANTLVLGARTWTALRTHPRVLKAVHMTDGDSGAASMEAVRDILELDRILVGRQKINSAREGQAGNLGYCWGPHAALLYIDAMAIPTMQSRSRPTFGWTAEYGDRVTRSWIDPRAGLEGATMLVCGERRKQHIVDATMGYLFVDAAAAAA